MIDAFGKLKVLKNLFHGRKDKVKVAAVEDKKIDLRKYILPIEYNGVVDKIAIYHKEFEERIHPTDYAVANGVIQFERGWSFYWLREHNRFYGAKTGLGVVPVMHLDLKAAELSKIGKVKDVDGEVLFRTMDFGFYPKTALRHELDERDLIATGKKYTGYYQPDNDRYTQNSEYKHEGEYYVCTRENLGRKNGWSYFVNEPGVRVGSGWYKVEPIKWIIKNWQELPKTINPAGSGKAEYIVLRAIDAITGGIPFNPHEKDHNSTPWENSTLRGYLNGGNMNNKELENGDFTGHGFLDEAFVVSEELLKSVMPIEQVKEEPQIEI